ncbi:MAG: hypothetical protein L3J07_00670 [Candidatus Magasanikbacteria bacterium]|nr:hypothetical protein [Candidatus Magasanikbacteria bacterium]
MKIVLIGYGEIGSSLYEVFSNYAQIEICDIDKKVEGKFDMMFVAIPYTENFVEIVKNYQLKHKPKSTIIFSTVAIGTSSQLGAVHSPVEGMHPTLADSIRRAIRWVGGESTDFIGLLEKAGIKFKQVKKPEHTEFLKLRSTSLYGVNIEYARYCKKVADEIEMDFEYVKDFDLDYNKLYRDLGKVNYQRYILNPPEGKIGGHCVVPNAKMLDSQFPDDFLKKIFKD